MSRVVFLLPPLLAMGCEPLDPQRGEVDGSGADSYAILLVDPLKLDFNEVSVNDQGLVVQSFTVENRGTDTIPVRGHDLALATAGSPGAFEVQSEDAVLELGPDERETLQVLFLPTTDASYVASLLIYDGSENDPQRREEVELQLSGVGTAPVLEVRDQAATVVAGVGCRGEQHVRVQNTGSEPLLIEDAVVKESLDFTVASVPTEPIEPGSSGEILVDFSPAWAGFGEADRSAWLEITTNDPALPSARTLLPAIAFEGADVLETFTYGSSAQADWLLLTDSPLDGLEPALEELLANTLSELSAAGLQVNIAAVGPDDTCPSTRPAFVTNEDSATSQAAFLVASLPLDAPEVEPDSLLEHAAAVLAESGPEGCLAGWRRAQRQLHVVLLTRSDASAAASQAEQLQQLTQAAGSASVVVSVLGAVGDVSCTGFDLPVSYLQAADETGGAALDLCRTGWSESASELGTPSTRLLNGDFTWFLQEVPLPESIELKADGISTPAASGWSYDAELNAVIIEDYLDLSTGTDIELRYMAALECEAS